MTFYHGSPVGSLTELVPELSEHGQPYVYTATDPLVALLYAVKPVPKPFSFYPYGFDERGCLVYSEYFEDSFRILYQGKRGYLYECADIPNAAQLTQITCAYTSTQPVKVKHVTEIADLYDYYREQESKGMFRIRCFEDIPETTHTYIQQAIKSEIKPYDLQQYPAMKRFVQLYFPSIVFDIE